MPRKRSKSLTNLHSGRSALEGIEFSEEEKAFRLRRRSLPPLSPVELEKQKLALQQEARKRANSMATPTPDDLKIRRASLQKSLQSASPKVTTRNPGYIPVLQPSVETMSNPEPFRVTPHRFQLKEAGDVMPKHPSLTDAFNSTHSPDSAFPGRRESLPSCGFSTPPPSTWPDYLSETLSLPNLPLYKGDDAGRWNCSNLIDDWAGIHSDDFYNALRELEPLPERRQSMQPFTRMRSCSIVSPASAAVLHEGAQPSGPWESSEEAHYVLKRELAPHEVAVEEFVPMLEVDNNLRRKARHVQPSPKVGKSQQQSQGAKGKEDHRSESFHKQNEASREEELAIAIDPIKTSERLLRSIATPNASPCLEPPPNDIVARTSHWKTNETLLRRSSLARIARQAQVEEATVSPHNLAPSVLTPEEKHVAYVPPMERLYAVPSTINLKPRKFVREPIMCAGTIQADLHEMKYSKSRKGARLVGILPADLSLVALGITPASNIGMTM